MEQQESGEPELDEAEAERLFGPDDSEDGRVVEDGPQSDARTSDCVREQQVSESPSWPRKSRRRRVDSDDEPAMNDSPQGAQGHPNKSRAQNSATDEPSDDGGQ